MNIKHKDVSAQEVEDKYLYCPSCDGYYKDNKRGEPSCGCHTDAAEDYHYDPNKPLDFN